MCLKRPPAAILTHIPVAFVLEEVVLLLCDNGSCLHFLQPKLLKTVSGKKKKKILLRKQSIFFTTLIHSWRTSNEHWVSKLPSCLRNSWTSPGCLSPGTLLAENLCSRFLFSPPRLSGSFVLFRSVYSKVYKDKMFSLRQICCSYRKFEKQSC